MGSEDQALTLHSRKSRRDYHHPKGKHSHQKGNSRKPNRDLSNSDVLLVMREETMPEIVLGTKMALTRRMETK